jgi:hypothetical protein
MDKTKNLEVTTKSNYLIPKDATVARNDGVFVTLARKSGTSNVEVFTCHVEDLYNDNILDDNNWIEYTREEIDIISKLKYLK